MPAILFVCTANVCRSPMAMALCQAQIGPSESGWQIESAGNWALTDRAAADNAQAAMLERQLDISDHRARVVDGELLSRFDLILTMERGQKEALQVEFPDLAERVYTLSELAGQSYDIRDPMGGSLDDFRATAAELDDLIARALPRIRELVET